MNLTSNEAQRIIRNLKRGVFPSVGIEYLTVGRTQEIKSLHSALAAAAGGEGRSIFLEADYGFGKSHMLKTIDSIALSKGFAVAWITLDGKTHAFNHPTRYLHCFLENLRAPEFPVRGLASLIQIWLNSSYRDSVLSFANNGAPWWLRYPINYIANGYGPTEQNDHPVRVLEARDIQHKNGIAYHHEFYERIRILSQLSRAAGLKGIVWLFDEVESIATLLSNKLSRFGAYSLLGHLVQPNCFPYSCFVFATTPDFRAKLCGEGNVYHQYGRGAEFANDWLKGKHTIHQLTRLAKSEKEGLLRNIRDVHTIAYPRDAGARVNDSLISRFLYAAKAAAMEEREIIKSFVTILEVCEQHPKCCLEKELFG